MSIETRPAAFPEWASSGTIAVPTAPKQALGWVFEEKPPFGYFNWLHNVAYNWLKYIDFLMNGLSFTGSFTSGGVLIKNIALEDNQGAEVEIYAAGLNGANMSIQKSKWSIYRKTGTTFITKIEDYNDGDISTDYINLVQNGNDVDVKGYTASGTWVASGSITIKSSGLITYS